MDIVKELEARGEVVYNPCSKSMLNGRPKVYVKGRPFPSKEFLCGTAIREKDGTISVLAEAMADMIGVGGFKIEDLGLCDPVLYYANHDQKTYPLKTIQEKTMELCKDCKFFGQTDPMYRYDRICARSSQKEIDPVYGNLTGTVLHCESERRYGACGKDGIFWEVA
jgi:hypothetical protein